MVEKVGEGTDLPIEQDGLVLGWKLKIEIELQWRGERKTMGRFCGGYIGVFRVNSTRTAASISFFKNKHPHMFLSQLFMQQSWALQIFT